VQEKRGKKKKRAEKKILKVAQGKRGREPRIVKKKRARKGAKYKGGRNWETKEEGGRRLASGKFKI